MAQKTISISERTIRITVRFSLEEISQLDAERGSVKRSEYIRRRALNWLPSRHLKVSQTIARIKRKLTDINQEFSRLDDADRSWASYDLEKAYKLSQIRAIEKPRD